MDAIVLDIATNLTSTLLVAGGRRLGEQALGNDQEQALKNAFAEATAAMLVEVARHADLDRNGLDHLKEQFNGFFEDRWTAETLVDVALDSEAPPVDELRRRYERLGFDSEALPVSFERAMIVFAFKLATRLREDARSGGPLAGIVKVADIEAMRGMLEEHVQARGASGPGVDELWKESRARCAERWRRLGLSREEAFELADALLLGAPSPRVRAALRRPLTIVIGEVGAGKSLLLDRLFQRAVVRLREDPEAPLPAFVEAADVEGRLQEAVVRKDSAGAPGWVSLDSGPQYLQRRSTRLLMVQWPRTSRRLGVALRAFARWEPKSRMAQSQGSWTSAAGCLGLALHARGFSEGAQRAPKEEAAPNKWWATAQGSGLGSRTHTRPQLRWAVASRTRAHTAQKFG